MSKKYKEKKFLKKFLKEIPPQNRKIFEEGILNPQISEEESLYLDGDTSDNYTEVDDMNLWNYKKF